MKQEAEYEVSVTITFSTNVNFAPVDRDSPITSQDALANFYGYGLSDVMDSGEYEVSVDSGSISVKEIESPHEVS